MLISNCGKGTLRKSYAVSGGPAGLATTLDDQFIIASVSKLLIRYALFSMVERGELSLDTPIAQWIEGLAYGDKITLRHLIDHTSGLPRELDGIDELADVSSQEFLRLAGAESLVFEPGTDTLYSNVGYQLVAEVFAALSPVGYDNLIEKYLNEPTGMIDTGEFLRRPPKRLARGFELNDEQIVAGDLRELGRFRFLRFYSTVDDLHRFGSALFDPSVTTETVLAQMTAGKEAVTHAGAMEGYRAYFYANPKTRTIIVILSNFEGIPLVRIIEDIPKVLAGQPYEVPSKPNRVAVAVDPSILVKYVGRFQLDVDRDQIFEIQLNDGNLVIVAVDGETTVLFAENESTFFAAPTDSDTVEFIYDQATDDYQMSLVVGGGMRLTTARID